MKKKLLSMAVAAAMTAPFAVQAENTVYGKVHLSVDYIDATLSDNLVDIPNFLDPWPFADAAFGPIPGGVLGAGDAFVRGTLGNRRSEANQNLWQVESRASRLGVKGSEDLGNGLKAVYKMEFEVDMDGEVGGIVNSRNIIGGLSHASFGTLVAGRHDTPYKMTFAKWDRFGDRLPDDDRVFGLWKGGPGGNAPVGHGPVFGNARVAGFSDVRANNVVAYLSPEFAGLNLKVATVALESNEDDALNSGGWSVGLNGNWGPIKGGLAYEQLSLTDYSAPFWGGFLEDDDTKWGAAIAWDQKPFYVGLRYEDRENVGNLKGFDVQQYQIAAEFSFGNNVLKAMYQDLDSDSPSYNWLDWDADAWAVGLDHSLSKRTKLYVLYMESTQNVDTPFGLPVPAHSLFLGDRVSTRDANGILDGGIGAGLLQANLGGGPRDVDAFSIGMEHQF